jgi:formylglycine-generating enzyme required for sulfatase activity
MDEPAPTNHFDSELMAMAAIRAAWLWPWAASRARQLVAALPEADRAALAPLLDEADFQRRRRWLAPLAWLLYLGLASAIVPPLIMLGAPHLLRPETEEKVRELERELEPVAVYLPPPDEEPPPPAPPEEVTGIVRPTPPGASGEPREGLADPIAITGPQVIAARVESAASRPSWMQSMSGGGGGGESEDGEGSVGIPAGMVLVPPGTFSMGSAPGIGEAHEHPSHRVELSAFAIDRDETTVSHFQDWCIRAGDRCGWRFEHSASMMADHPVTGVTWHEARAYCSSLGKELPTEAQWEKAARWDPETGAVSAYPWGNGGPSCSRANYHECGRNRTVAIASLSGASPLGVRDMAGNAREWCQDRLGRYPAGVQTDPRGPSSGDQRVLRGGSWGGYADDVRAMDRDGAKPGTRNKYNGFRCVVGVEVPESESESESESETETETETESVPVPVPVPVPGS